LPAHGGLFAASTNLPRRKLFTTQPPPLLFGVKRAFFATEAKTRKFFKIGRKVKKRKNLMQKDSLWQLKRPFLFFGECQQFNLSFFSHVLEVIKVLLPYSYQK